MSLLNKATPAILLASVLATPAAFAEENTPNGHHAATVTFEAHVRAASCNVTSTTEGGMVNWGVFTSQSVKDIEKNTAIGETKNFNLVLTECSQPQEDDSTVLVHASGSASQYNPYLFANSAAKSLAVELKAISANSEKVDVLPNKEATVSLANKLSSDGFANIPMEARLMKVNETNEGDSLKVPVTFTVSYN
ncbi:TPA: type 1 fimbrial protein [Providencia alcalifaciens]|nr:type 1 fimbrial protein [Providencia alcalifaciens]